MRKININVLLLGLIILAGCNMPKNESAQNLNVTQAYQTVNARLTEGLAQQSTPTQESTLNPTKPTDFSTTIVQETKGSNTTPSPSLTSSPKTRCDQAAAAYPKIDITIDDDTKMTPGQKFTKIWRIVNVGTCTWTPEYQVVFFSGEQMGTSDNVYLEESVAPNQSIDISVDMVAPKEPGSYQSNWKLKNTKGDLFGIGPHGESPFWVRIKVIEISTPTPTMSPTTTPTPDVLVSGSLTMTVGNSIDLDTNTIDSGDLDLAYQTTEAEPPVHQLVPLGNASIGIFGNEQPTLSSCQNTTTSSSPLDIAQIPIGTYLCYQTSLSLPGWIRIDSFNPDNNTIRIQILTWLIP